MFGRRKIKLTKKYFLSQIYYLKYSLFVLLVSAFKLDLRIRMMQIYNLNNRIDAPIGLVATKTSFKTIIC